MTELVGNLQTYEMGLGLMGKGGKSRNLALKGIEEEIKDSEDEDESDEDEDDDEDEDLTFIIDEIVKLLQANGKKVDLIPYPGNSLNRNLLSQNTWKLARLTSLSFSRKRVITHLPILAGLPPGEAVRPPKWLTNLFSTSRSSSKRLISKGSSSQNTERRKLLTTSSRVIVNPPTQKKKV